MLDARLKKQLEFIVETDKMKSILRQTLLMDSSRRETDAEHCWQVALMSMLLAEYASEDVDISRAVRMLLTHDLIEIYAGDTFAFDAGAALGKEERERAAADRLFSLLPESQGDELRRLWEEFDRMDTPDSRYAATMDRLQPFIANTMTDGHTWRLGNVTREMVYRRIGIARETLPALWPFIEQNIDDFVKKGAIKE